MQSAGLPAVEFEKKLLNSADKSVLFGAVIATNLEEAVQLEDRLKKLPAVAEVDSITRLRLNEDQSGKLRTVGQIKAELASIAFGDPDPKPVEIPRLSPTLYSFYGYLGAAYEEARSDDPSLATNLISLHQAVGELRKEMLRGGEADIEAHAAKLGAFQQTTIRSC
jgi:hypothetical protein